MPQNELLRGYISPPSKQFCKPLGTLNCNLLTCPTACLPNTQHVVVEKNFGLEADFDQVGDDLHVLGAMSIAVHTN